MVCHAMNLEPTDGSLTNILILGANLNAQIGLTNPATCGGDVCHMNLHKTFAMYVVPLCDKSRLLKLSLI